MHVKVAVPRPLASVAPGQDFYKHINGTWLSSARMPPINTSYGVSEEVEAEINERLLKIMKRCQQKAAEGKPTTGRREELEDAIGRLALSALREEKQKYSVEYLKRGLRSIGCLRGETDISQVLGTMCRFRIPTVLSIEISPELRGGKAVYVLAITPGSLGLPDTRYYAAAAPGKTDVLFAYTKLLRQVTGALDTDDIATVIPLEGEMSTLLEASGSDDPTYYKSLKALSTAYPKIAWGPFFAGFGLREDQISEVRVDSAAWLKYVNGLITKLPLEQWYKLFALHTILHALPFLPPPFDTWHFELFEKMLRGQQKKLPQIDLTLKILKEKFGYALDYFFIEENLDPGFKSQATAFVRHILKTASLRVRELEWLGEKSKVAAAKKIENVAVSVAWAQELREHPRAPPLLQTDNLLANVYLLESAYTEELLRRLPSPVNLERVWDEPAFTVNAYYYHETNQILIPAASFAWPFYSIDHGLRLGWNYGGLGAIIGHELTHAFDEDGKELNEKGESGSWWSAADLKRYKEHCAALIRVFDQAKIMGRQVSGTATLSENLADLGGLGIALDALKRELGSSVSAEKRKHEYREFFRSYATSWRTKERVERTLQRLFMDRHAPVELRVNLIVPHFDEWYEAFDVRTGDDMYLPPEERIRIF